MSTPPSPHAPANCRERLKAEGKAYPRSSCEHCGSLLTPGWKCPHAPASQTKAAEHHEWLSIANKLYAYMQVNRIIEFGPLKLRNAPCATDARALLSASIARANAAAEIAAANARVGELEADLREREALDAPRDRRIAELEREVERLNTFPKLQDATTLDLWLAELEGKTSFKFERSSNGTWILAATAFFNIEREVKDLRAKLSASEASLAQARDQSDDLRDELSALYQGGFKAPATAPGADHRELVEKICRTFGVLTTDVEMRRTVQSIVAEAALTQQPAPASVTRGPDNADPYPLNASHADSARLEVAVAALLNISQSSRLSWFKLEHVRKIANEALAAIDQAMHPTTPAPDAGARGETK